MEVNGRLIVLGVLHHKSPIVSIFEGARLESKDRNWTAPTVSICKLDLNPIFQPLVPGLEENLCLWNGIPYTLMR